MHETALAAQVIRLVEARAQAAGAARVLGIRLEIGEFAGIEPALLRQALADQAGGTRLQGASVVVELVKLRAVCENCCREFLVEQFRFQCPACASGSTRVVAGEEMVLKELSIAVPVACAGSAVP